MLLKGNRCDEVGNEYMQKDKFFEIIKYEKHIAIYGAGLMGKSLFRVLSEKPYFRKIDCFIVKTKEGNPDSIQGINVISIEEAEDYIHYPVFVALHEKNIKSAIADLKSQGFECLIPITFDGDLWSDIREIWLESNSLLPYGVYKFSNDEKSKELHIYVIHSEFDKELDEVIPDKDYEISIQVGAATANKIYYEVCDNIGENISDKNKQYCELTGLYWAWKNDKADYIGISHYRRKFIFDDMDICRIKTGNVDIIVTVPVMNLDTVRVQYIKDHSELDWNVMTDAIQIISPEYMEALKIVESNYFYFAYNMFVARRTVLDEYCNWLFSILKYCEEHIGIKDDLYQNRYIGFLAERLFTIYIAKHTELHVAVAKKHFLETKV